MAITTITNAMVSVNAIQGTLIADNAITAVHIATNAVSGTLIADNAVTATHIAQNTITVTQLADDAVEAAKIADGVITTNHLNKAMISSQTEVTAATGDFLLIGDTSDSNNLKKVPVSGVTGLVSAPITALNNATANELVTVGSTTTELDAEANLVFDGTNLLVGLSSSIANASLDNLQIGGGSGNVGMTIYSGTSNYGGIAFADGNTGASDQYPGLIEFYHNDNSMRLYTANTERMRIDSSGKVGIGTTSPARTLHVNSADANVASFEGHQGEGLVISSGTDGQIDLIGYDDGASSYNPVHIRAGTTGLYFDTAGKVGVGTSSPSYKLDVELNSTSVGTARFLNKGSISGYQNIVQMDTWQSNGVNHQYCKMSSGNGSAVSDDEFNFRGDGNAYADGSWNGGGADYAEYFEWNDGNPSTEDRVGYSVSLVNNKIKIAESGETVIGVISGNPAVVGDNSWNSWKDKYQKDDYGRYIRNSDGHRISNPDYDDTLAYSKREDRKEWDVVGLMGKLRIKKGQQTGTNWIKMRDISASVEEWLVR